MNFHAEVESRQPLVLDAREKKMFRYLECRFQPLAHLRFGSVLFDSKYPPSLGEIEGWYRNPDCAAASFPSSEGRESKLIGRGVKLGLVGNSYIHVDTLSCREYLGPVTSQRSVDSLEVWILRDFLLALKHLEFDNRDNRVTSVNR